VKSLKKNSGQIWLAVIIFMFWASLYMYVPILPVYAATLKNSALGIAGIIVSMYGLTQFILRVPLGIASDKLKKRKIFVIMGLLLSCAAAIGMGFTRSAVGVASFRGVSGVAAATWVITTVLFASYFSQESTVKAAGLAVFISVFAQLVATLTGGIVANHFGYQAPFFGAAILAGIGVVCLAFFREKVLPRSVDSTQVNTKFTLGWSLVLISLAAAVGQFIMYATTYGYVPILADKLGATSTELGWLAASMQVAYMITSFGVVIFVPAGYEKVVALIGIGIIGAASFWVLRSQSVSELFLTRVLHGIGHGLSYPVLMGLAIKPVANQHRATAMSIFQAVYAFGMFTGPAVSGWIVERAGLSAVFSTSAWIAFISIPVLGLGLFLTRRIVTHPENTQ